MMFNDSSHILDDLLSRWHHRCMGFKTVRQSGATASFRRASSNRVWDTTDEVLEDVAMRTTMEAMDFHILGDPETHQGGLEDPYYSAIIILARNCYTGRKVWLSPRLPKDPIERGTIILEARNQLTKRLLSAGVM